MRKFILAIVLLSPCVMHGTIVVVNISKGRVVVAADSRASGDNFCKVFSFNHRIVFSESGSTGPGNDLSYGRSGSVAGWTNQALAREAIQAVGFTKGTGSAHIRDVATKWATLLVPHWEELYRLDQRSVLAVSNEMGGYLTSGFFAEVVDGLVYLQAAGITVTPNSAHPIGFDVGDLTGCTPCGQPNGKVCFGGKVEVPTKLCASSTAVHPTASAAMLEAGWTNESLLALKLADLAVAYDTTGTIGGVVDVLELDQSGTHWLARKPSCSEDIE